MTSGNSTPFHLESVFWILSMDDMLDVRMSDTVASQMGLRNVLNKSSIFKYGSHVCVGYLRCDYNLQASVPDDVNKDPC